MQCYYILCPAVFCIFEIFLQGIMDINGNVCRQIVNLAVNNEFKAYLCEKLPAEIDKILIVIEKIDAER